MHTPDSNSHPDDGPNETLSWAVDDDAAPTELTIFNPRNETTTHWITIETDYVHDLADSA